MTDFQPIPSGLRPGEKTRSYDETISYFERTIHALQAAHAHVPNEHCDHLAGELYEATKRVQDFAEQVITLFLERLVAFQNIKGFGSSITDPSQVLGLLPPHRVTAGPTPCPWKRGYDWSIAFKPSAWPHLAALVTCPPHELKAKVSRFEPIWLRCISCTLDQTSEAPLTHVCTRCGAKDFEVLKPARNSAIILNEKLASLRANGYDAGVLIDRVTKSNIFAKVWCYQGET